MARFALVILVLTAGCRGKRSSKSGQVPSPSGPPTMDASVAAGLAALRRVQDLSLIHISEPTRPY